MLGRYSLTGYIPDLGAWTASQKARAVRIGGFSVAALALLSIPVIFAWPAIVWWRKYGFAVKFGKRRVDAYRRAKASARRLSGSRKNPGAIWFGSWGPTRSHDSLHQERFSTRRDALAFVSGHEYWRISRMTPAGAWLPMGRIDETGGLDTEARQRHERMERQYRTGRRNPMNTSLRRNAYWQRTFTTVPEVCPKCSHGRMEVLPARSERGTSRMRCPQCRHITGATDHCRPKKKSIKRTIKPRNLFEAIQPWGKRS